jgi:glycosyltransferase involved in cell wall biosynthesis
MSVKKPLRIAFLTPEFVAEGSGTGGLASYVYRISKALMNLGHEVEVFIPVLRNSSGISVFDGIRVERARFAHSVPFRIISRLRLAGYLNLRQTYIHILMSLGISQAFAKREEERPFDFVQSSDVGVPGLFVKKRHRRPLLVRCSWARDVWLKADGTPDVFDVRCVSRLERMLIHRADISYAPSRFVADYYSNKGLKVAAMRPPFLLEATPSENLPWELPPRFLFHFGTLGPIKGTDVLAAALPLVWGEEPDFTMVFAGECRKWTEKGLESDPNAFKEYSKIWGKRAKQVIWLREIEKPQLYAVLKRSEAAVLPSRCDNLPNTAIESLSLGVPVIGTLNSSIDELVEPGINGEIVPIGDPVALARTMIRVWRREVPWTGKSFRLPPIFDEMDPHVAALNLIRLSGFGD